MHVRPRESSTVIEQKGGYSMKHPGHALKHIVLRLVEEDDAEFILSLRIDDDRNRYLSTVKNDLNAQREWIKAYKNREARSEEYYYVIEASDSERLGVVRLYDFRDDSFCWGSWILKRGAPKYAAIESALAVYELAFYTFGFNRSHFDVVKGNDRVIAFHRRFGAKQIDEDETNVYFVISKENYETTREKYRKFLAGA